jgi:hypothetical protein
MHSWPIKRYNKNSSTECCWPANKLSLIRPFTNSEAELDNQPKELILVKLRPKIKSPCKGWNHTKQPRIPGCHCNSLPMQLMLSHFGGSTKAEVNSHDTMSWLAHIPYVSKVSYHMVVLLKANITSQV